MTNSKKNNLTDEELVARAIQADKEAFGELYERYLDEIQRYVFYRVANRFDAEDLTETIFLKVWESLPRFESPPNNLRAWLYRIAHNTVVDYYRTNKINVALSSIENHDGHLPLEYQIENLDESQKLADIIKSLDVNLQQVIVCRFINGLSHAETALIMNIGEGYVRVLQLRALQKLRQLLEKE